jgi:hypothetical protein
MWLSEQSLPLTSVFKEQALNFLINLLFNLKRQSKLLKTICVRTESTDLGLKTLEKKKNHPRDPIPWSPLSMIYSPYIPLVNTDRDIYGPRCTWLYGTHEWSITRIPP